MFILPIKSEEEAVADIMQDTIDLVEPRSSMGTALWKQNPEDASWLGIRNHQALP